MTKTTITIILLLLSNYFGFSQTEGSPDLLIHYSNDNAVKLYGYSRIDSKYDTISTINDLTLLDSLIKDYKIQVDIVIDSIFFSSIKHHLYLDSSSFSALIKKTNLIFASVKYGYAGATNYSDLTIKYGVKYYAGGCSPDPSEWEKKYYRLNDKLLKIRNGQDWENEYNKDEKRKK